VDRPNLDYALEYCRLGLAVFPLNYPVLHEGEMTCSCHHLHCKNAGKHPAGGLVPNGVLDATTDKGIVQSWFGGRSWNVGIATGKISGIVALDCDPRHGGDKSLAALIAEQGPLPETLRFRTGGGGEHILFRHPGGSVRNSVSKIAAGIDVRGDGGYIVAPPSRHESGRHYSSPPNGSRAIADLPAWLTLCVGQAVPERPQEATSIRCLTKSEEARIRSAVKSIPADNRDVWLRVGMALHWTGWGAPARAIWDEWSRTSSKFDSVDQDRTWRSFGRSCRTGSAVTLGTLFALAKQHGWQPGSCRKLIAHYAGILLVRGIEPHACIDLIAESRERHGGLNITDEEIAETVAFVVSRESGKRARQGGSVGGR
jgi:hypothetical protein